MKKIKRGLVVFCLTMLFSALFSTSAFAESTEIYNVAELNAFLESIAAGDTYEGDTVILVNSINMDGATIPNTTDKAFKGTFDGKNNTISNFYITQEVRTGNKVPAGLFGSTESATIKNLTLDNVTVSGDDNYVGALIGEAVATSIENCHVKNSEVSGKEYVGGLVGKYWNPAGSTTGMVLNGCTITNTPVSADGSYVGGIVGQTSFSYDIIIRNCATDEASSVTGKEYVGGIIGYFYEFEHVNIALIENCVNNATVTGTEDVGGIVGYLTPDWNTSVTLENCYNTGAIKGSKDVGGIAGSAGNELYDTNRNFDDIQILNVYNTGKLIIAEPVAGAVEYINGIAKMVFGTIKNALSFGLEIAPESSSVVFDANTVYPLGYAQPESATSSYTVFANNYTRSDMLVNGTQIATPAGAASQSGASFDFTDPNWKATAFAGWDTDVWDIGSGDSLPTLYSVSSKVTQSPTITLRYTFESNGGSAVAPIEVELGAVVSEPQTTKSGETFDGWYYDATFTNKVDFSSGIRQGGMLYAKWEIAPTPTPTQTQTQTQTQIQTMHLPSELGTGILYINRGDSPVITFATISESQFAGIWVDGVSTPVESVAEIKFSSVILTLKPSFTNSLSNGMHTISVITNDGSQGVVRLFVGGHENPQTGYSEDVK